MSKIIRIGPIHVVRVMHIVMGCVGVISFFLIFWAFGHYLIYFSHHCETNLFYWWRMTNVRRNRKRVLNEQASQGYVRVMKLQFTYPVLLNVFVLSNCNYEGGDYIIRMILQENVLCCLGHVAWNKRMNCRFHTHSLKWRILLSRLLNNLQYHFQPLMTAFIRKKRQNTQCLF